MRLILRCLVTGTLAAASQASATEGGTTFYLLGSGGPGTALPPPVEGLYFDNTTYIYNGDGSAEQDFVIGGELVANVDANVVVDFPTLLFVPAANPEGATISLGLTVPVGNVDIGASANVVANGETITTVSNTDEAFIVGDPVATIAASFPLAKNTFIQPSMQVSVPVGNYREGQLANLAFRRWIVDTSLAMTWHDPKAGWDISTKVGYTFDGTNSVTQYNSGNQFHAEASIEKSVSSRVKLGAQYFYLEQVEADSGEGAVLGAFKGRTQGVGVTASYSFVIGKTPIDMRARAFKEFDVRNRLEGESFFLSFTLPLKLNLPS